MLDGLGSVTAGAAYHTPARPLLATFGAPRRRRRLSPLLAQAQGAHDRAIAIEAGAPQVVEQATSLGDHPQKPPPRVVIFDVGLEVLGQVSDALGQERDLHFGRASI